MCCAPSALRTRKGLALRRIGVAWAACPPTRSRPMPMPDMPAAALEKIQSQDLKRDAAQAGSQPHTVIVELDIPTGKIEAAIPKSRTYPGPPKLSIAPPADEPRRNRTACQRDGDGDREDHGQGARNLLLDVRQLRRRRQRRATAKHRDALLGRRHLAEHAPGRAVTIRPTPSFRGAPQGASPEPMNADAS